MHSLEGSNRFTLGLGNNQKVSFEIDGVITLKGSSRGTKTHRHTPVGINDNLVNTLNYMHFIMSEVYKVMFQEKFPRVLLEMEEFLQFILGRRIGYWFILKEHTIIRFYGFIHEPYIFPAFLTPRIFSLEFIRKNLIVENEDFLRTRNYSKIKFPLKVGPFIIKNKASLPVVEGLL